MNSRFQDALSVLSDIESIRAAQRTPYSGQIAARAAAAYPELMSKVSALRKADNAADSAGEDAYRATHADLTEAGAKAEAARTEAEAAKTFEHAAKVRDDLFDFARQAFARLFERDDSEATEAQETLFGRAEAVAYTTLAEVLPEHEPARAAAAVLTKTARK